LKKAAAGGGCFDRGSVTLARRSGKASWRDVMDVSPGAVTVACSMDPVQGRPVLAEWNRCWCHSCLTEIALEV
jgi:hypothetical protein